MSTKPKKPELIVHGYVHDIEKQKVLNQIIPSTIASVIMLFFSWINEFRWNKEIHGKDVIFVDDKTIKIANETGVSISENIISSDLCNWYEWEFTLSKDSTWWRLEFGFIATPVKETIKDWDTVFGESEQDEHYTINIHHTFNCFRPFGKNASGGNIRKHDKPNEEFNVKLENGDRFRVRIDFKDRDVKLYYNDQFVNSVYKNDISDSVVAAASIYNASIAVTKTQYE